MPRLELTVASLHFYPIKSCAGTDISEAQVGARGIHHDRGWLVVDQEDKFVTQREVPIMALIKPSLVEESGIMKLKVEAPEMPPLLVPEVSSPQAGMIQRSVTVWGDTGLAAIDQGDDAANWFSQYMKKQVRLVRMDDNARRDVQPVHESSPVGQASFQDAYPFLIISSSSLDDLNSRLSEKLPINRFRPNIVIDGSEPFAEDTWQTIKIGDILLEVDKPCARCVITTIDQQTAKKNREPLKTLSEYRMTNNQVMFGQNAINLNGGTIKVSDKIEIVKLRN